MSNNTPVPNAEVKINNTLLPFSEIESAQIDEEINTPAMCVIKISNIDTEKGNWKYMESKILNLGDEITISMGIDAIQPVFSGEIVAIDFEFSENLSTISIRGYDRLHRLQLEDKTRTFTEIKDSDLAQKIAGDWGLSNQVESTQTVYPYLCQNNQHDLEFLLQRAKRIRYELGVDDKKLFFRKSKENSGSVASLEYKVHFSNFSPTLSTVYRGSKVKVQGWDVKNKAVISGQSSSGQKVSQMGAKSAGDSLTKKAFKKSSTTIVGENIIDATEAKTIAGAQYNASLIETVEGEGHCMGNPVIRIGKTIELLGIGRLSGVYYVFSTTHRIDDSGYTTSFGVRRTGI
ncbi:phage late control D family protein [Candidatus Uabimicrobium sp. HlEnr_7]|uniref:phage late control D family protein n=1 Tax=Candidatus Uabimicrobium helgolandensis TaxID=3095367 RepID=UPI0035584E09